VIETFSKGLPADVHALAEALMAEVCLRDLKVAVAESCTGGLAAAVLTDVEGHSHGFDRGFVTYTDEAKHALLDVAWDVLRTVGAVSPEAAKAMAAGALAESDADLALSITGFAGPGGPDDQPGLVYFGTAVRGREPEYAVRRFADTDRTSVRIESLRVGFQLLLETADRFVVS
jgi:nicotinamide-nucleotide amidase